MQFLKPTISKVILTVLAVAAFVPFITYFTGIFCITTPCPTEATGSLVRYLLKSYNYRIFEIHYATLALGIIATYILVSILTRAISRK